MNGALCGKEKREMKKKKNLQLGGEGFCKGHLLGGCVASVSEYGIPYLPQERLRNCASI